MMSRSQVVLALLITVVVLALAGRWARRGTTEGCALDGMAIEPLSRVRIVDAQDRSSTFCCIRCAELWLEAHKGNSHVVHVTDETSGEEVEASRAWFVRSPVVTKATTGNRIHAFRDRQDAERHATTAQGKVLSDGERPFACCQQSSQ